jgi:hypothetical protein
VIDQIEGFANPTSATSSPVGTVVPIALNASSTDIGEVQPVYSTSTQQYADAVVNTGENTQQTFTSPNLDQSAGAPVSPLMQLLQDLQAALLDILAYLKPFGGNVPSHITSA